MTTNQSPLPPTTLQRWEGRCYIVLLSGLIAYCLACTLTIPFIHTLWLGEIPVLALVQLPKVEYANWLRSGHVRQAMYWLGFSSGSPSPDHIRARPFALAIAYLYPLVFLIAVVWMRTRMSQPYRRLTILLVFAAAVDFVFTLVFASGRSLTIY